MFSFVFLVCLSFLPTNTHASTIWEVAVVFLGAGEDADFQADVDKNILELARTEPNALYRLSILRDFAGKSVQYFHSPKYSKKLSYWDPLFFQTPQAKIQIPGILKIEQQKNKTVLNDESVLKSFFSSAFENKNAHRMAIIYGHGEGFRGLRSKKLLDLQNILKRNLPYLDILWFDSCFMSSIEALYQLRNQAHFFIASEDSEFSAGTPFDSFSELQDGPDSVEDQARRFAMRFVESYSFIKEGSQTGSVGSSSATVSLIQSNKIKETVRLLKNFSSKFNAKTIQNIGRYNHKITMDDNDFVDLGTLLKISANIPALEKAVEVLANHLELNRKIYVHTNPRIKLKPNVKGASVVFGYENWARGYENDRDILERLPENLKPTIFIKGPENKKWPSREINKYIYVSPFMPGIQTFNYFFINMISKKTISNLISFVRARDYVTFESNFSENPILFTAYTQSIGKKAEKYTGINISNPTNGVPSFDYVETDFFRDTHWGSWRP